MSMIKEALISENEWGYSLAEYLELKDKEMRERMEAFEEIREILGKEIEEIEYNYRDFF